MAISMTPIRPSLNARISVRSEQRYYCKGAFNPKRYKNSMDPGLVWRDNYWADGTITHSFAMGNCFKMNQYRASDLACLLICNNLEYLRTVNGRNKTEWGRFLGYKGSNSYATWVCKVMHGDYSSTPGQAKLEQIYDKLGIDQYQLRCVDLPSGKVVFTRGDATKNGMKIS